LQLADWVSLKIDSVDETVWRLINRPHQELKLKDIQEAMLLFADKYNGILTSETMLVEGIKTSNQAAEALAIFLEKLSPNTAYLSIPTRPPSEKEVNAPDENSINRIFQIVNKQFTKLEYLTGYEGNAFTTSGDPASDILPITAVHPMREEAINKLLTKTDDNWTVVQTLINEKKLREVEYE